MLVRRGNPKAKGLKMTLAAGQASKQGLKGMDSLGV